MTLPFLAAANLAAWLALVVAGRRELGSAFAGLGRRSWAFLAALTASQVAVHAFLVAPKHLTYIDEFWYLRAGRDILESGAAPGYAKSIGWPVMIALSYAAGGVDNLSAIRLAALLGALVPAAVFLAGRLLLADGREAAAAALLCACLPNQWVWSATAETAAASLLFTAASVVFTLAYLRGPSPRLLCLSLASWAMASQIRPENIMGLGVLAAGIGLFLRPRPRLTASFVLPWLACLALCLPNLLSFAAFQSSARWLAVDSHGAAGGANFGLANLAAHTARWAPVLMNGSLHPVLFSLAAAAGAWDLFARERRKALLLALWLGLFYAFYFSSWLQYYGGSEGLFPKTKLFGFLYPALCLAAGRGFLLFAGVRPWGPAASAALVLAALLGLAARAPLTLLRSPAEELEARVVSQLRAAVPEACVLAANAPVIAESVLSSPTVSTEDFLSSESVRREAFDSGCVLLLRDITDRRGAEFGHPEFLTAFSRMGERFSLDEEESWSWGGVSYGLYRVRPR